jgi:hypothetical protein
MRKESRGGLSRVGDGVLVEALAVAVAHEHKDAGDGCAHGCTLDQGC